MVNRINAESSRKRDKLYKTDATTARGHQSEEPFARRSIDGSMSDDVIASLANAHENRRARQVTEWESMRGQSVQRAV